MNRRSFLSTTASGLTTATGTSASARAQARQPNVLIVLTDDQGYGDFSCHGNPVLKTPHMDKLHAESVRFTDFHAAPMCTPTRGELMSGVDALKNRATSVTAGRAVLRRDLPTMADIFRSNGYSTGIFGKWHLGDAWPYRPMERGFDVAKYHLGWGFGAAPEFDNDYFNGRYRDQGVEKRFSGYCTDFWFDEAMAWMKRQQTNRQPFLCYLPTNTPHAPNWVAAKYRDQYRQSKAPEFFGMIANLDENLGRMDAFLTSSGLKNDTIVVFMTDNGATQGFSTYNAGMRGRKTLIYEGGHRVPCFVRWPGGGIRKPADVDTPAQVQDVLPTLIDLCAIKAPPNARFDGASLVGLLRDGGPPLAERMMVVQYGQVPKKWDSTVIWKKWRLVNGTELYNIDADAGQTNDVSAANAEVVAKMREHYEKWWAPIEPTLRDFQPLSIGGPENPVVLTSSDWQDIYCDNNGHVSRAEGGARGGKWRVKVEQDGRYRFELSRWPFHLNHKLTDGRAEIAVTAGKLPAGKAMPIAGGRIEFAGKSASAKSSPDDKLIPFELVLSKGASDLQAWFTSAEGTDVCGAFYARVTRL